MIWDICYFALKIVQSIWFSIEGFDQNVKSGSQDIPIDYFHMYNDGYRMKLLYILRKHEKLVKCFKRKRILDPGRDFLRNEACPSACPSRS